MAGPTSGILEIPISLRDAVLQVGNFSRAATTMAANVEKELAKVEVAQGKLAAATKDQKKTLNDIITAANASANAQAQALDKVINKYKEYKAEINSAMARRASESDKERAAYDMLTKSMPAGPGPGYSGSLSGPVAQFIDIRQRHVSSVAAAADRPHERAAYNAIEYGRVAPDEGAHVNEKGAHAIFYAQGVKETRDAKQATIETNRELLAQEKDEINNIRRLKSEHAELAETTKIASTAKTGAIATEAAWHVELMKNSQQIEANQKKMRELAVSEVGSSKMREQAMNSLAQQTLPLAERNKELSRLIEQGTGGLKNNRVALQQLSFGIQDFISAGGLHNLAQGARGAANNLEMMAMSLGSTLSPLKLMGLTLLPTAALAAVELAVGFKKSADSTSKAADAMAKYEEYVKRTKEEVVDLTMKENERELHRARREAGAAAGEGVVAEKAAWDAFRDIEHKMNVYSGKEQPTGIGDRLASGWFAFKSVAARAANNAGEILGDASGAMGGNRGAWWKLPTAHDQLADAELRVRGIRGKKEEGVAAAGDKDRILGVRRDIRNEVDRRNKEIEAKEENKHAIEGRRNDAVEDRRGRPLRKRDARDFDMQLKEADDEIKGLRDRLKRLEREARDKPNASLDELKKSIDANTEAHNRNAPAAAPARLPNLGFGPMDAIRGMGWNV